MEGKKEEKKEESLSLDEKIAQGLEIVCPDDCSLFEALQNIKKDGQILIKAGTAHSWEGLVDIRSDGVFLRGEKRVPTDKGEKGEKLAAERCPKVQGRLHFAGGSGTVESLELSNLENSESIQQGVLSISGGTWTVRDCLIRCSSMRRQATDTANLEGEKDHVSGEDHDHAQGRTLEEQEERQGESKDGGKEGLEVKNNHDMGETRVGSKNYRGFDVALHASGGRITLEKCRMGGFSPENRAYHSIYVSHSGKVDAFETTLCYCYNSAAEVRDSGELLLDKCEIKRNAAAFSAGFPNNVCIPIPDDPLWCPAPASHPGCALEAHGAIMRPPGVLCCHTGRLKSAFLPIILPKACFSIGDFVIFYGECVHDDEVTRESI
jgi:hypothetical protein